MEQNTIAVIWDFDKTLIPGYMQDPIFEEYKIDGKAFWNEVNALPKQYGEMGIRVNNDTIYLNHMITCVSQGIFEGLNNEKLNELGSKLKFYKGVPQIFEDLKKIVSENSKYQSFSIHVEHYIVSTGITQMIRGSKINDYVDGIWGCEFIETPILSNLKSKAGEEETDDNSLKQTGYIIDNTSKTRAIFEINKGTNKFADINVNSKIERENRRVPFENMIYIADGPSDIPTFSIIRQYGGRTFAIYPQKDIKAFNQVNQLMKDGRIDMFAPADYSEGTPAYMWLTETVKEIAERMYNFKLNELVNSVTPTPQHLI